MSDEPEWEKKTIRLAPGHYARLQALHPRVGANAVIRNLVEQYLSKADPTPIIPANVVIDL